LASDAWVLEGRLSVGGPETSAQGQRRRAGQVAQAAPGLGEVGCRSALGRAACGLSCESLGPTPPPALGCPDRVMGWWYCIDYSC